MSDVRFACSYCSQHIACDSGYAGAAIDCPACGGRITVPRAGAPVATRIPAAAPELDLWTEEEWEQHVRENPGIYSIDRGRWQTPPPPLPIILAAILPVLVLFGATAPLMWAFIVLFALLSGFAIRREAVRQKYHPVITSLSFFIGVIFFGLFAEVFLLGGCCWPGRYL